MATPTTIVTLGLSVFLSILCFPPSVSAQSFDPMIYKQEHIAGVWQKTAYLNGPAKGAMLYIDAMTIDSAGNIYIIGNYRVRVIDTNGRVWNLAGNGVQGYKDGPAQDAMFNPGWAGYNYQNIAVDSSGSVFVPDGTNKVIRKIYKSGGQWQVTTYAGNGSVTLTAGNTGSVVSSPTVKFGPVVSVAIDSFGNVWTGDYGNYYKITPSGTVYCYANPFGLPISMSADGVGNVYSLTRDPYDAIYKITASGVVSLFAGIQVRGQYTPVDGTATTATGSGSTFWMISTLAVSPSGIVYAGNGDECRIRRVKDGYTMTLHPDGFHTDADRSAGWPLGGPMFVAADGTIYVFAQNPPNQPGLRKLVPVKSPAPQNIQEGQSEKNK